MTATLVRLIEERMGAEGMSLRQAGRGFWEGYGSVLNGEMSNETFRDLAAYAAFKIQLVEENDANSRRHPQGGSEK